MVEKKSSYSLFEDDNIKNAVKALSDEDREKYSKFGEYMYGKDKNFETAKADSIKTESTTDEQLCNIIAALRSGLHPSSLTEDEKIFMRTFYDRKWYKDFGYTKKDLKKIYTYGGIENN